jgi:agmatine deiminase
VYAEIVRVLHEHERVEIICHDETVKAVAQQHLDAHGVRDNYRLHVVPTDRVWLRDSGPTGVIDEKGEVALVNWKFNAWAKYPNFEHDAEIGRAIENITGLRRIEPTRPDTGERVVLEGGGIETDGEGTMLVTEEWLLSDVQVRNPGLSRDGYESVFRDALGIRQTIWLGEGCVGDDTPGSRRPA